MTTEKTPTLEQVAHFQSDEIWDVIALLDGARKTPFVNEGESGERLIRQAIEKLKAVQMAFDPYI